MTCQKCQDLENRLTSIVNRSITELHDELYPKGLGKRAQANPPEVRLVIISKFSGRSEVLEELGANTNELEERIIEEAEKIRTV